MLRILLIALLFGFSISFAFSQDSTKKNAVATGAVKPVPSVSKNKTNKYPYKPDSASLKHGFKKVTDSAATSLLADKSLRGQYQLLLTKVYRFQQPFVASFWKSNADTLRLYRRNLNAANIKITAQAKTIDSLKAEITGKDQTLSEKVTEMDFLGMSIPLSTYSVIVWGIVILLGIVTFVVITRSGSFRKEAHYRTQLYTELEDEFKAYKTKANDKEKKLARELQTERNKLDELLGRG